MCEYCGTKAGYLLINAKGSGGVYYRLKCKHCTMPILSAVMRLCDVCGPDTIPHVSYDSKYLVYTEAFVRRTLREQP